MIRPYNLADKEPLLNIFKLNIPKYFDPIEINEFVNYLDIKGGTYFTVEFKNEIVGGIGYEVRESDESGRINWIFFHPDFSRLGLGKKAVEHCLAILKSNPKVDILIVRTSQLAYQFFEKCGYKLIETEKDYWAKGLDLYLMYQPI